MIKLQEMLIHTVKYIYRKFMTLGFPEQNLKSVRNTEPK